MKAESIETIQKLRAYCDELLSNEPGDVGIAVSEMQSMLARISAAENDTVEDILMTQEEVATLRSGYIINAIKAVRNRTGLGLKESKDLVERAGDKLRLRINREWQLPKVWQHL